MQRLIGSGIVRTVFDLGITPDHSCSRTSPRIAVAIVAIVAIEKHKMRLDPLCWPGSTSVPVNTYCFGVEVVSVCKLHTVPVELYLRVRKVTPRALRESFCVRNQAQNIMTTTYFLFLFPKRGGHDVI